MAFTSEGWQERLRNSRLASLPLSSRFTIPSGIVTTTPAVIARMARDVPALGFLTTKTLSLEPRVGYREPIIFEYYPGCFVNAVGLANPGAEQFREAMRPYVPLSGGKPLVVSLMGQTPEEFLACAQVLDPITDAFELNLSCPHVKGAGQTVGSDPEFVRTVLDLLRNWTPKPLIPKLSPNLPDVVGMAQLCADAGADGLSLINTVGPGMVVDEDGNPILSHIVGGLSGAGILPIGLKIVREVSTSVNLPIIASGGIGSWQDVRAYEAAGATFFGVGSRLAGMTTPEIALFFSQLAEGLTSECPREVRTAYVKTHVKVTRDIGANLFFLELEGGSCCQPGQFFFLRIPGIGEKPFSPMGIANLQFLVRQVGPFTTALRELKPGDPIFFRGPYGRGFPAPGAAKKVVLVGGGTGVAPLVLAASMWRDTIARAYFGFSQPVALGNLLQGIPELRVVIDPPARPGEVIRKLIEDVAQTPELYEECQTFVCGPASMMAFAAQVLETTVPKHHIYLAREDIMRCGIGLCGSCGTEDGLRSCVDGPVFPHGETDRPCFHHRG